MCDWTEILYLCGHKEDKKRCDCHFARNDPIKQCFGPQVVRDTFTLDEICGPCKDAIEKFKEQQAEQAEQAKQGQQGQQEQQGQQGQS
jgi:hypothetical protein